MISTMQCVRAWNHVTHAFHANPYVDPSGSTQLQHIYLKDMTCFFGTMFR